MATDPPHQAPGTFSDVADSGGTNSGAADVSFAADASFRAAFELPGRLPAIRLPAEADLAAMARRAPLLASAGRLAEWAGPARAVDAGDALTAADTMAAATELGLPAGPDVTSMQDVPELVQLWKLAIGTGFLEAADHGETFGTGAATGRWHDGTDAEALAIWSGALMFMATYRLDIEAGLDLRRGRKLDFYGTGMGVLALLFLARRAGLRVADANAMIRDAATSELSPVQAAKTWTSWARAHGESGDVLLHRLAELGAVTIDGEAGGPEGGLARLTPLGSWAVREQLAAAGVQIPLLPPPAEMTAADLVAAAEGADCDQITAEADAWLAQRDPDEAARELLDFAAAGNPVERMVAISAAQRIGPLAVPRWRDALDVRAVRPYAKIALTEIAVGAPGVATLPGTRPEADDVAWLVTDLLAAAAKALESADLAIRLGEAVPKGAEEMMFGVMSRLPHPDAARVLTMIGQHHPDKNVARAARRAAHQVSGSIP
jgi:hypothetical protein